MITIGMVHGRFQPFHKEHLAYVLSGISQCRQCIIGITNPDDSEFVEESTSAHRHLQDANPFTYFQRAEMIKESLLDLGVNFQHISIVPFHLFHTSLWRFYIPKPHNTTQLVRVFSPWEQKKINWFEQYGFKVKIIDKGIQKTITGEEVRRRLSAGANWQELVPEGTQRVIELIMQGLI